MLFLTNLADGRTKFARRVLAERPVPQPRESQADHLLTMLLACEFGVTCLTFLCNNRVIAERPRCVAENAVSATEGTESVLAARSCLAAEAGPTLAQLMLMPMERPPVLVPRQEHRGVYERCPPSPCDSSVCLRAR